MSTVKTTNITHGSNTGTANMVLGSDGSVTFAGGAATGTEKGRNALINGGMQVAQYPSPNSAINTYGPLDRWRTMGGPMGYTITQVTDGTNYPNTHTALKAHRTAGNTQEYDLGVAQGIETLNSRSFAGKECTFSFRARVGANFSGPSSVLKVGIWHGTGTDDNPLSLTGQGGTTIDKTVSTTAAKYSITYTIPASVTQITCLVYYQCRGTAGANDWFEITDCQFELGPVATDFEIRDYGYELARCQRYYETHNHLTTAKTTDGSVTSQWSTITSNDSNTLVVSTGINYKVPKRASPTVTIYNPGDTTTAARVNAQGTERTVTATYGGPNALTRIYVSGASSGNYVTYNWEASAEL